MVAADALKSVGITLHVAEVRPRSKLREAWRALHAAAVGEPYVMFRRHDWKPVRDAMMAALRDLRPDALYLDHLDSLVYADAAKSLPVVIDLHNVYSDLIRRESRSPLRGAARPYLGREAVLLRACERRAVIRADSIHVVSAIDAAALAREAPGKTPKVVPNGVDCTLYGRLTEGRRGGRPVVAFIGAMSWPPNVEAARFLALKVFPEVRRRVPGARLRIIGRDPTPEVLALRELPGVEVTGKVPDVMPHLQEASCLAVPLEVGGGTRLKILEAFAAGLPVVSTPVGCEGIEARHGVELVVATREGFGDALVALLEDPSAGERMAKCARSLVVERYDWKAIGASANAGVRAAISSRALEAAARPRILELRSVFGTGGGPEKTILLGTARTDRSRYEITVCYIRDARDPIFSIGGRAAPLGVDYVEVVERSSFDVGIIPKLRRLIRDRRIDIIHAHDPKTNVLTLLLAKLEGAIPLTTAHGYTGNSPRELRVYYPLDKRLMRYFPIAIAVSEDLRETAIAHGAKPERVRTITNGIDASLFRRDRSREAAIRAALGVRPDEVVIGSVGRAARQKRFDLLLRAFAEASKTRPGLRLLIAGDGEERAALERLAEELGVGRACLLGHRSDIADLHHAFDIFVQSSDYEGTPNAVLEAMAFETPVVATTAGGTAQLVEDGVHGLLLAPGDERALARRILEAVGDPEGRARRAAAARRRVEGDLSFDTRMRRVEAIYDELMATQPTPRTRLRVGRSRAVEAPRP